MMPKILKNFNLFVDGRGYVGRCEDVTPPKLNIKTEEFRAGGLDSPVSIDMGMEKLEASFTLVEYDKDILKQFGLIDGNSVQVTLRGAMQDDTTTSSVVITLHGRYSEIDMGKFSSGEKATLGCTLVARYYSLQIDGETIVEVDVDNMTRIIDGNDQMQAVRDAIGI